MLLKTDRSNKLYQQALTLLPGGVDSPVRAFRAVGGQPLFIKKGKGLSCMTWTATAISITCSHGVRSSWVTPILRW